jgi:hypothetical protein
MRVAMHISNLTICLQNNVLNILVNIFNFFNLIKSLHECKCIEMYVRLKHHPLLFSYDHE